MKLYMINIRKDCIFKDDKYNNFDIVEVIMKCYKEQVKHGDTLFPFDLFNQTFNEAQMQTCRIHWHDETEWVYVVSGTLSIFVDSVEYVVPANSLLCIQPKMLHYMIAQEACHYYTCIFHLEMLEFKNNDAIESEYLLPLIEQRLWFKMPISMIDKGVNRYIQDIDEAFMMHYLGYQLEIKATLLKIIAKLIRLDQIIDYQKPRNHKLESIETIFHYIESHYDEKMNVETLADLVNYNTQYFTRYFKQHTGETPIEYLTRIRLEKSLEQLMDTDKSILDISLDCGFDSCSYFIKRFTQFKHQTPHSYRQMVKQRKIMEHDQPSIN